MAASRQPSQRRLASLRVVTCVVVVWVCGVIGARDYHEGKTVYRRKLLVDGQLHRGHHPIPQRPGWQRSDRPNIIMIMTDDQDLLLGMGFVFTDSVVIINYLIILLPKWCWGRGEGASWHHLSIYRCVLSFCVVGFGIYDVTKSVCMSPCFPPPHFFKLKRYIYILWLCTLIYCWENVHWNFIFCYCDHHIPSFIFHHSLFSSIVVLYELKDTVKGKWRG